MADQRAVGVVEDPVCGMTVEAGQASASRLVVEHDGRDYLFCGKGCLLEFRDAPERYLRLEHEPGMPEGLS